MLTPSQQPEQLLLAPCPPFLEALFVRPKTVSRRCKAPRRAARAATTRPTRWIPGTAPVIHLPQAGTRRTRRYRAGHKPGSIGTGKLSRDERSAFRLLEWELLHEGVRFGPPRSLAECEEDAGPCGHTSCGMNLYVDIIPPRDGARCPGSGTPTARSRTSGNNVCPACTKLFARLVPGEASPAHPPAPIVKLNFPDKEIDEIPETCALRAANAGGVTLEEVGRRLNLTMGRADQLEKRAVRKCADVADDEGWGEAWRGILART